MEVLVAAAILVVGIWAMLQIFAPGMGLKKHAAVSQSATRFAEGQRIRFGDLPVALVKRNRASGLVDFSVSSLEKSPRESVVVNTASGPVTTSIEKSWDYLYQVRTVVGEKVKAGPYVFLRFGPAVRATQLAYFPEPYEPVVTSTAVVTPTDVVPPFDGNPNVDSWNYNRYYSVDENGDGTPDAAYLAFDDYTVNVDGDTDGLGNPVNEPRWLLINYSYLDAGRQVRDVVGNWYQLPPTDPADWRTYTVVLSQNALAPGVIGSVIPGNIIPGSESVFRVVGTSLYPPLPTTLPYWYAALPYRDDDPSTPLIDETTAEGPGIFAFKFRPQGQDPGQFGLPLPGETLLANYDFAGHLGRLDFGPRGNPSFKNVSLPEVVWEDHLVPSAPPYEIHLDYKPLEGNSSTPLTDSCPSYLMAVVKEAPQTFEATRPGFPPASQSGRLYPDSKRKDNNYGDYPPDTPFDIDIIDGLDGSLRFAPEIGGKWVRVYYRVQRRWITHIVKAAADYAIYVPGGADPLSHSLGLPAVWDSATAQWRVLYEDPSVSSAIGTPKQFWLIPSTDPITGKTELRTQLPLAPDRPFYKKAEVAVDYVYDGDKRVSGEEHQIDNLSSGGYGFTLNHPNVTEIISIRGASARVRVAWRSPLSFHKLKTYELRTQALWRGSESD